MIIGGAGCGKSTLLTEKIRDAANSNAEIRTFVPEQFAFTYDRRLYDALGAEKFNKLHTGTFRLLTAEILEKYAEKPRDAADTVVKTVILHQLLRRMSEDHVLRFYGKHAEKPAFLTEMTAQLTELMQAGSTPEHLLQASAETTGVLSEKLYDIARIYAGYLDELERRGMRDVLCDTMNAAALADASDTLSDALIFLDEYESFTGDQYAILEIMLRDAKEVWIALRTDNPDAPDYTRFDAVNQTARQLRRLAKEQNIETEIICCGTQHRFHDASLAHLSRFLFTSEMPPFSAETAVTITEARDITLETEYVCAQIRRLLREGMQCREIMVVMHDPERYGFLLEAAFQRYEIPYFMDLRRSVLYTAVMKLPLCLLSLAQRTATEQILILLKTQLSPLSPTEAASLENYAYIWDIEGMQWENTFAKETDPSGYIEQIRNKLIPPILSLRKTARKENITGAELCEALYRCMETLGIPMRVGALASRMNEEGNVENGRALRRLWNRLTELLDALHEALAEIPCTPQQLADMMTMVLRTNQIPVPPQTLDAVTVQSAAAARYDEPKTVFVLGVNDGQFPADIQEGGFFTEQERSLLNEHGVQLARSVRDLCADERLIVYKTLSAASERLWLCYPLAGEDGGKCVPSSLLGDVRTLLPNVKFDYADSMGTEFYVSTKAAAYYSFVQDYTVTPRERASVHSMLKKIPEEAERLVRMQQTADSGRLRVQDKALLKKLTGSRYTVSATQIEKIMKCPFMGFCSNNLRLAPRIKQDLNKMSFGNLVHDCMERLFREHPEREDFLSMSVSALKDHAERCASDYLRERLGGSNGRPARFLQQYARMTARMTALLLHTQEELRQSEFIPDACELIIGRQGDDEGTAPYQLTLSDGTTLYMNGKIDRVDLTRQDGKQYLRIIDYKTGAKQFSLGDIYYGLNLQMLLYLFALMDDSVYYPDAEPAGVLYMPAGSPKLRPRSEEEPVDQYISKYFRMSGTVLLDRGILSKMEQEIAGIYIPVQLSSDDDGGDTPKLTKESNVFTKEQLLRLRAYVEDLVKEAAELISEGETAPAPMKRTSSGSHFYEDACRYCDFRTLCSITEHDEDKMRLPMSEKEAIAAMQKIMNGETEGDSNEQMDS